MKINKLTRAGLFTLLTLSGVPTWSIPLSDVGSIDTLIASAKLTSNSQDAELSWVESVLSLSNLTFESKNEGPFDWQAVDGFDGVWAQELSTDPEYFLVKAGANSSVGPNHSHFLFENISELAWAVVDLEVLGFDPDKVTYTKISHISEFAGGETTVPEPASFVLMFLGVLGLSVIRQQLQTK